MSPEELLGFRSLLEAERARVAEAIANLQDSGKRTVLEEGGDAGGVGADTASVTADRELDEGLEQGAAQTLALINRALAHIDEGSYGLCERCGRPIGGERLKARPWAVLCIDDQRIVDRS